MKPPKYNFYFEVDGTTTLGYNSLTPALAKFTPEEFAVLQEYTARPRGGYLPVVDHLSRHFPFSPEREQLDTRLQQVDVSPFSAWMSVGTLALT